MTKEAVPIRRFVKEADDLRYEIQGRPGQMSVWRITGNKCLLIEFRRGGLAGRFRAKQDDAMAQGQPRRKRREPDESNPSLPYERRVLSNSYGRPKTLPWVGAGERLLVVVPEDADLAHWSAVAVPYVDTDLQVDPSVYFPRTDTWPETDAEIVAELEEFAAAEAALADREEEEASAQLRAEFERAAAERERAAAEAEIKRKAEEEARLKAEEARQKAEEEAVAKRKAEEEAYQMAEPERARERLRKALDPQVGIFASAVAIPKRMPMLVDGFVVERGVSVFSGHRSAYKTTLLLDMAAHIAAGASWQDRAVSPRPVIWYAIEGADAARATIAALEGNLRKQDTPWGDFPLPIRVFDSIPDSQEEWARQIEDARATFCELTHDRSALGELPTDGEGCNRYPDFVLPLVVVDTLSMWLGGEDERGPGAVDRVQRCIDLTKEDAEGIARAAHVFLVHHLVKSKDKNVLGGHRAIEANTSAHYLVKRPNEELPDKLRPHRTTIIPQRTKYMEVPEDFAVVVTTAPVPDTEQVVPILVPPSQVKVPEKLAPVLAALRGLESPDQFDDAALNGCVDVVAAAGGRNPAAVRKQRERIRKELETLGIVERIEDDNLNGYRFNDAGPSLRHVA